jgi:hypothetical protein
MQLNEIRSSEDSRSALYLRYSTMAMTPETAAAVAETADDIKGWSSK